jgi:hypothetical protein
MYTDPSGNTAVTVNVNGKTVSGTNTNGTTVVALRDIATAMGGTVSWVANGKDGKPTATVSINNKTLTYDTTGTSTVMVSVRDFVTYVDSYKNVTYTSTGNGKATCDITSKNPVQSTGTFLGSVVNNVVSAITGNKQQSPFPYAVDMNGSHYVPSVQDPIVGLQKSSIANTTTPQKQIDKFINVAQGEIGYKETPENYTKYGKWYGDDGVLNLYHGVLTKRVSLIKWFRNMKVAVQVKTGTKKIIT